MSYHICNRTRNLARRRYAKLLPHSFYLHYQHPFSTVCCQHMTESPMFHKDLVSSTVAISKAIRSGNVKDALDKFWQIRRTKPDKIVFLTILNVCCNSEALPNGKLIHACIIEVGLATSSDVLKTALVKMYGKCGYLEHALKIFNEILEPDAISWTTMITAYSQGGDCEKTMQLFWSVQLQGIRPSIATFSTVLNLLSEEMALADGKMVHANIIRHKIEQHLGIAIFNMYGNCGSLGDANKMFTKIIERNLISWNTLICFYSRIGNCKKAFDLFYEMHVDNIEPNDLTFIKLLSTCVDASDLPRGVLAHSYMIVYNLGTNNVLITALMSMYGKCSSLETACSMFDMLSSWDTVSWTVLIGAYSQLGTGKEALQLLQQMVFQGIRPNRVTFVTILNSFSSYEAFGEGKLAHAFASRLESDLSVGNAIINMYAKCWNSLYVHAVFERMHGRDVVSWNSIIALHSQYEEGNKLLKIIYHMQQLLVKPNKSTLVTILCACASSFNLVVGKIIHSFVIIDMNIFDLDIGTSLVNLYGKCGSLQDSCKVFFGIHERNVTIWNALMAAFMSQGHDSNALVLFHQMCQEGMLPDEVSYISIFTTCGNLLACPSGKLIHAHVANDVFNLRVEIRNALIGMYAKCGNLDAALTLFNMEAQPNVVSWNTILASHIQNGHNKHAVQVFENILSEGIKPSEVTFLTLISACTNNEALADGKMFHSHIIISRCDTLDKAVNGALINMYSKCGYLEAAHEVLERMQEKNIVVWNTMIAAYAQHGQNSNAMQLFQNMWSESVIPNEITVVSMLHSCAGFSALFAGKFVHACIISSRADFGSMVGNALINMYGKCGRLTDAHRIFDEKPRDVISWTSILASHAQYGHGNEALKILSEMKESGLKPDNITLVPLLTACNHAGLFTEGYHCFISATLDCNVIPMIEHYHCLIDLLGRGGWLDEMCDLLNGMPFQAEILARMVFLSACVLYRDVCLKSDFMRHVSPLASRVWTSTV